MPKFGEIKYCKVMHAGGLRYFYFRLKRYIYDKETNSFIAGSYDTPTSGFSLDGLSTEEVERRIRLVGPNVIQMSKPNILHSVLSEFSGPFYI